MTTAIRKNESANTASFWLIECVVSNYGGERQAVTACDVCLRTRTPGGQSRPYLATNKTLDQFLQGTSFAHRHSQMHSFIGSVSIAKLAREDSTKFDIVQRQC